jgi:hypothetical protein
VVVLVLALLFCTGFASTATAVSGTREINITNVYSTIYTGVLIVTGNIEVSEGSPSDCMVFYWGALHGNAIVTSNGSFAIIRPYAGGFGELVLVAGDKQGNLSNAVYLELLE